MTVLEAIQKSTEYLARKQVDSPRLQSELLLAHLLEVQRLRLYLDFGRKLSDEQIAALREMVRRRGEREPLQHIVGSTSFCGIEIKVTREVLVPRPETELLAEQGWTFLNQLAREENRDVSFIDFGTGSGCIAIALAANCARSHGYALDISAEALAIARENIDKNELTKRLHLLQSDGFAGFAQQFPGTQVDLIIANPPYIPSTEAGQLQDEVRRFDPPQALYGGSDGLEFFRLLAREAPLYLHRSGKLLVEFGDRQEQALEALFAAQNWIVEKISADYTGRPRTLAARLASS